MDDRVEFESLINSSDIDTFVGQKADFYRQKWRKMYEKKGSIRRMQKAFTWSWPGFLLMNYWMFYRKMYLQGSVVTVMFISAALIEQTTKLNSTGYIIGLMIMFGVWSNGFYFHHVGKRIKEIRATTPPDQLDDKLRDAGNPSLGIAIGLSLAFAILAFALSLIITAMGWNAPQ